MIRILVADGSPASLSLAKRFLEGEGYGVITASSGIEAIEKVFSERPDLVLLDIELPAKDGFSVCEAIKENPETAEIPVLIFTRLSRREDRERGLKAGADDYLVKPFSAEGLLRAIRKHIRRSREIEVPSEGYILRISRDDWEREVYASKRYYVGVPRKWKIYVAPLGLAHSMISGLEPKYRCLVCKSLMYLVAEAVAIKEGMMTILHDALIKAVNGETSIEEVLRVSKA